MTWILLGGLALLANHLLGVNIKLWLITMLVVAGAIKDGIGEWHKSQQLPR